MAPPPDRPLDWRSAWQAALYGPGGFYRRDGGGEGPAAHFRTAAHAAPLLLARALGRLADGLGASAVVDVGAGRGELLTALAAPTGAGDPPSRGLHGVDLVPRPVALPAVVGWSQDLADVPLPTLRGALVVAWERLDVVPCTVLQTDDAGQVRVVLVDPAGVEELGGPADPADLAWCRRWWPPGPAGSRTEIGRDRDAEWARLVRWAVAAGAVGLLAVDYAHLAGARPPLGTLSAYRSGRLVPPVPDGSCDLTAHVALDAVAAAGQSAGARTVELTDQRTALRRLGVGATPGALPGTRPDGVRRLADAAAAAELLDPSGLGGFGWLLQVPAVAQPPASSGYSARTRSTSTSKSRSASSSRCT